MPTTAADYVKALGLLGAGLGNAFGGGEEEDPNWQWNKDTGQYYNRNSRKPPQVPTGYNRQSSDIGELKPWQGKALVEAEDNLPALEVNIQNLNRALELNPKTFDGWFANERGDVGAMGPEWLSGALGIDKDSAAATNEWKNIMTPEAIDQMSRALTGATTEKELATFRDILSNPNTPKPVRERYIKRMLALAEKKRALLSSRVKELRGAGATSPKDNQGMEPPQGAIDALNSDPELREQFEEKYGVSADDYLLR